jgi:hypothetical protein
VELEIVTFKKLKPHRGFRQPNSLDPIFRTGLPFDKDAGFALENLISSQWTTRENLGLAPFAKTKALERAKRSASVHFRWRHPTDCSANRWPHGSQIISANSFSIRRNSKAA